MDTTKNVQVKIEFCVGLVIFGRLAPISLWKKEEIFSFPSLSPQQLHTFNSNLTFWYIKEMGRSSMNFVMVRWLGQSIAPFTLKKISFRSLSPQQLCIYNSKFRYVYAIEICRSISNLVMVQCILTELCPFTLQTFF
jgi:hypothetical protein